MSSRWKEERHVTYNHLQWVKDPGLREAVAQTCGSGDAIVSFGCGTATNLQDLRGKFRRRVGVEASAEMLAQIPDEGIEKVHSLIEDTSFDAEFDCAIMRNVLHYVEYPEQALVAALRSLKPGGRFVLVEGVPPNTKTTPRYAEIFSHLDTRHIFNEGDLISYMRRAGFRDILVQPVFVPDVDIFDWIDKRTDDEETRGVLRALHTDVDSAFRKAYELREEDGRVLMTWRFALVTGTRPRT